MGLRADLCARGYRRGVARRAAGLMHALHLRARGELDLGKVAEADAAEALQFGRQRCS